MRVLNQFTVLVLAFGCCTSAIAQSTRPAPAKPASGPTVIPDPPKLSTERADFVAPLPAAFVVTGPLSAAERKALAPPLVTYSSRKAPITRIMSEVAGKMNLRFSSFLEPSKVPEASLNVKDKNGWEVLSSLAMQLGSPLSISTSSSVDGRESTWVNVGSSSDKRKFASSVHGPFLSNLSVSSGFSDDTRRRLVLQIVSGGADVAMVGVPQGISITDEGGRALKHRPISEKTLLTRAMELEVTLPDATTQRISRMEFMIPVWLATKETFLDLRDLGRGPGASQIVNGIKFAVTEAGMVRRGTQESFEVKVTVVRTTETDAEWAGLYDLMGILRPIAYGADGRSNFGMGWTRTGKEKELSLQLGFQRAPERIEMKIPTQLRPIDVKCVFTDLSLELPPRRMPAGPERP